MSNKSDRLLVFIKRSWVSRLGILMLGGVFLSPSWTRAEDYILGPEDVVQISVWGNPGLGVTVPVRPDGKISMPLGDEVLAAGRTPSELRDSIAQEVSKFIKEPAVSVVVTQINSPRIYVIGSFQGAGVIPLRSETTMLQLLASLGPLAELDLKRAYIIRDRKRLDLDLRDLVEKGASDKDVILRRGDIIHIPNAFGQRITVIGEVARPSNINYRQGITVVDAIIEAGWVTQFANLKHVLVVRDSGKGRETLDIDVTMIREGKSLESNVDLIPGDLVIIKERLF